MTIAETSPAGGLQFCVDFIEDHGDHTHRHSVKVPTDPSYLVERGVTFGIKTEELDDGREWFTVSTYRDGKTLAEASVDPAKVPFDTVWYTLRDATLDVLSAQ